MPLRPLTIVLLILLFYPNAHAQNVGIGIGTTNPQSLLDLGSVSGNRIIFWGEGNQSHYGIGSQNGNMQIYANLAVDNIGFGLGRSNAFAENLRMSGNGMIGIYNNTPAHKLDVNGRIKLSGIDSLYEFDFDPFTLEIYNITRLQLPPQLAFNNSNNTAAVANIGVSPANAITSLVYVDTYFGIRSGSDNSPRLGLMQGKDLSGNNAYVLAINGRIGAPGQILRSRGPHAAAYWTNQVLPELHNQLYNAYGSNMRLTNVLKVQTLERDIPSSEYGDPWDNNFELQTASKLLIKYRFSANNLSNSCSLCGPSIFDIVLTDNNQIVRTFRYTIPVNTSDINLTGTALLDVPAGWHQIKMGGYMVSGPSVDIGYLIGAPINTYTTDGLKMTIQVIPSFK